MMSQQLLQQVPQRRNSEPSRSSSVSAGAVDDTSNRQAAAFVFQDCASSQDELSYQAGSEASSVRHILSSNGYNRKIEDITTGNPPSPSSFSVVPLRRTINTTTTKTSTQYPNAPPASVNATSTCLSSSSNYHYRSHRPKSNKSRPQYSQYSHRTNTNSNTTITTGPSLSSRSRRSPRHHRPHHHLHPPLSPLSVSVGDISSVTSASMTSGASTAYSSESSSFYADISAASPSSLASGKQQNTLSPFNTTSNTGSTTSPRSNLDRHFLKKQKAASLRRGNMKYTKMKSSSISSVGQEPSTTSTISNAYSGGEGSDAEISNLTSSGDEASPTSASKRGFLGRLLRPPTTTSNSSNTITPYTPAGSRGPSPKTQVGFRQNDDINDTIDNDRTANPNWALSPKISSIPEEYDSDRGSPTPGGPPPGLGVLESAGSTSSSNNNDNNISSPISNSSNHNMMDEKETIISPSTTSASTVSLSSSASSPASNNNNNNIVSPQSQQSLSSLILGDSSSLAGHSFVSGYYSEATGVLSEATPVIRNTSGDTKTNNYNARGGIGGDYASDVELGKGRSHHLQQQLPPSWSFSHQQPNHQLAPHHHHPRRTLAQEEAPTSNDDKLEDKSSKRSFCAGTQGIIICLLIFLFVFGVITVVVSLVLSKNWTGKEAAPMTDGSSGGNGSLDDDAYILVTDDNFNNALLDNGTQFENDGAESSAPTRGPSFGLPSLDGFSDLASSPTARPTLDEANALFADAVEELLEVSPSIGPTIQPTVAPPSPTQVPTTTNPTSKPTATMTLVPTAVPTPKPTTLRTALPTASPGIPQMLAVSFTETASPTSQIPTLNPTQSSTTLIPTEIPTAPTAGSLLLHPGATLAEDTKLWGQQSGDASGSSIALSGDGQVLVVGSPNAGTADVERSGQVQIFERSGSEWRPRGIIQGVGVLNQLGFSVACNDDGSVVVVSEPTANNRRGRVFIYSWKEPESEYAALQALEGTQPSDHFGLSLSISGDGSRLAVGSPYYSTTSSNLLGKVDVFEYSEGSQKWEPMNTENPNLLVGLTSLDWFGWSVALSEDGQMLAVGAPRNTEFGGYVQCFLSDQQEWKFMGPSIINVIQPVKLDDRFGHAVSFTNTGTNGEGTDGSIARVAIGAPSKDVGDVLNSGMVAIYEFSGSNWILSATITENEPGFYHQLGYSMQMKGDVVAVGVPGWSNRRGLVNLWWLNPASSSTYSERNLAWESLSNPLIGDATGDDFGFSLSLSIQREPSALVMASGAIMVSTATPESKGYSKVFRLT